MDIDTDMDFPQHLGMDNDALDINDINFMDENILKSKLFHLCPGHKTDSSSLLQASCRTVLLTPGRSDATCHLTTPSPPT